MKTINNKQYEECFVVMLATNEKSNIEKYEGSLNDEYLVLDRIPSKGIGNGVFKNQHLYILSDDKIKKDDWFIEFDLKGTRSSYCNIPFLCDIGNTGAFILTKNNGNFPFPENCKKIIATTDKSLIIHKSEILGKIKGHTLGRVKTLLLPQIPQSFIEHYIEQYNDGSVIDKVLVEYNYIPGGRTEEPDTFENGYGNQLVINPDNTINILTQKDSWSRDEVIALIEKHTTDMFKQRITLDEWIEENL